MLRLGALGFSLIVCAVVMTGVSAGDSDVPLTRDGGPERARPVPFDPETFEPPAAPVPEEASELTADQLAYFRTAFGDASLNEARELAERKFADELDALGQNPLHTIASMQIDEYLPNRGALVNPPGPDEGVLIHSTFPLRDESEDGGGKEPLDGSLEREGGHFESANPLVDVSFPDAASEPVRLQGADVGIELQSSIAEEARASSFEGEALFYHEAEADTDLLLSPVLQGAELLAQIRSAGAPERLSFELDVPAGTRLEAISDGSLVVAGSEGRLARITAPVANDSNGVPVDSKLDVTGPQSFDIVTAHREASVAYPVLVDPIYENYWHTLGGSWQLNGSTNTNGWTTLTSINGGWSAPVTTNNQSPYCPGLWNCFGQGLYLSMGPTWQINSGTYTHWYYQVPGQTSYVTEAHWYPMNFTRNGENGWQTPHPYWGLYRDPAPTGWLPLSGNPGVQYSNMTSGYGYFAVPASPPLSLRANNVLFGMTSSYPRTNSNKLTAARTASLGGAYIGIDDPEAPTVADPTPVVGAPAFSSWLSEGNGTSAYVNEVQGDSPALFWRFGEASGTTATDSSSSGAWAGTFVGAPNLDARSIVAQGDNTRAAIDLNGSGQYVSSGFQPFVNGTTRTFEGWAKRDSTDTMDTLLGGDVNSVQAMLRLSTSGSVQFRPHEQGSATIWPDVWPGTGTWVHWALVFNETTNQAELFLDGESLGVKTETDQFASVPGNLKVGARGAGGGDAFDGQIDEIAVYNHALTAQEVKNHFQKGPSGIGWVRLDANDPGLGVQRLKLTYTKASGEQSVQTNHGPSLCDGRRTLGTCYTNLGAGFPFNSPVSSVGLLPEGISTLTASAEDPVSHTAAPKTVEARVDRSTPSLLAPSGGLWSSDPGYDLTVTAHDGDPVIAGANGNPPSHTAADRPNARSGMKRIDLFIDRDTNPNAPPIATTGNQACTDTWGSCQLTLNYAGLDPESYEEGDHLFTIVATDQLGHQLEHSRTEFIENTPPTIGSISGALTEGWVTGGSPQLSVSADDAGAGVKRITLDAPGNADSAVDLNGTNQFVASSYTPFVNGSVRTFSGWANRDDSTTADTLFSSSNNPGAYVRLLAGGNDVGIDLNNGGGDLDNWIGAWPGNGMWVHWAVTVDEAANTAELFVNGISKGTLTVGDSYPASPGNFEIGRRVGTADPFDGKLDEVAVYERALTSNRIQAHHESGAFYESRVAFDDPSLYWRLGETSGATAVDASAGGNHSGTYVGSPTLNVADALGSVGHLIHTYGCSGGCQRHPENPASWEVPAKLLAEGKGTVTATAYGPDGAAGPAATKVVRVDRSLPEISELDGPSGWLAGGSETIAVTGENSIAGVEELTIELPGGQELSHALECDPDCPTEASHDFEFDSGQLPNGVGEGTVRVRGPNGIRSATFTLKVDHDAPAVTATGRVLDTTGAAVATEEAFDLEVTDAGSGVDHVSVSVDGVESVSKWIEAFEEDAQDCDGGVCTFAAQEWVDFVDLDPGEHTVELTVSDAAGNTTTTSNVVNLDTGDPEIEVAGDLAQFNGQALPGDVLNSSINVSDESSGVETLTVAVDGEQTAEHAYQCEPVCVSAVEQSHQYIASEWSPGPHDVTFTATDAAGNFATQTLVAGEVPADPDGATCSEEEPSVLSDPDPESTTEVVSEISQQADSPLAPTVPGEDSVTGTPIDPVLNPPDTGGEADPSIAASGNLTAEATSEAPAAGFTVGDAVCLRPTTTTSAESDAVLHDPAEGATAAVYANSAPQTDTIYRPTASGAALVMNMRGEAAPEVFRWNLVLDDGERLEELSNGGIAIVDTTLDDPAGCDQPAPPTDGTEPSELPDATTQLAQSEYDLCEAQDEVSDGVVEAVIAAPVAVDEAGDPLPATIEAVQIPDVPPHIQLFVPRPPSGHPQHGKKKKAYLRMSADFDGKDCPKGKGSPCGDFKTGPAVDYALSNGKDPNSGWWDYGSNDCTNFMSQILLAGGMQYMREFKTGKGSWWTQYAKVAAFVGRGYSATHSWTVADTFARHFWAYGLAVPVSNDPSAWKPGDLVVMEWLMDDEGTQDHDLGAYDHFQFVTGRKRDQKTGTMWPTLAQHSDTDYSEKRWDLVVARIQEGPDNFKVLGTGWRYRVLRPVESRANLGQPVRAWGDL